MKKTFLRFFSLLTVCLMCFSCSSDEFEFKTTPDDCVSIQVQFPSEEVKTRAASSNLPTKLNCYIYNTQSNSQMIINCDSLLTGSAKAGTLNVPLYKDSTYNVVFFAKKPECSSNYIVQKQTITTGNDENTECFYAIIKDVSKNKGLSYSTVLKRPFAQLNIYPNDVEKYRQLTEDNFYQSLDIQIDGSYSSINVIDGSVTGAPVSLIISQNKKEYDRDTWLDNGLPLFSAYLLVDQRKEIDVKMSQTVYEGANLQMYEYQFNSIPVQRNYKTNIYTKLLTDTNSFRVEINPEYYGSNLDDKNPQETTYDFDLVVKSNWKNLACNSNITINLKDGSPARIIDLSSFVASNNTLKFSFDDLGIDRDKVYNYYFCKDFVSDPSFITQANYIPKVSNMSNTFYNCKYLTDVSCFSNEGEWGLTNVNNMFFGCKGLTSLDTSNFNVAGVKDFSGMFAWCDNLINLDVSAFNTTQATNMANMFDNCISLENLDVSKFDTSGVTDMSNMFRRCLDLKSLDVSNFDTSRVTDMSGMFHLCSKLPNINVASFNTSNVLNFSNMFASCAKINSIDVSNFDTRKATNMMGMFSSCTNLSTIEVSDFKTQNVQNMAYMFHGCRNLKSIDVSGFNTSKVEYMQNMFSVCDKIGNIDVSHFDTANVKNMSAMFESCKSLTEINVSNFNTGKVTDMSFMFEYCSNVNSLDVSNFDTRSVTDMHWMFYECCNLKTLDVSNFNTSRVTNLQGMFRKCSSLNSLDVSNFDTSKVTDMGFMFSGSSNLLNLDLSSFNTNNVVSMKEMFDCCNGLLTLDVHSFNTSKVTDFSYMFRNCESLILLDLSSFDVKGNANCEGMFIGCNAEIIRNF